MFRELVFLVSVGMVASLFGCSGAQPGSGAAPAGDSDHKEVHIEKCDETGQKDDKGNPVCSEGCIWDPAASACKVDRPIVIQCLDPRLVWSAKDGKCIAPLPPPTGS